VKFPNPAVLDILLPSYGPCPRFASVCRCMRWNPPQGHVPRDFLGAEGDLDEVKLVLIVAEPGDPQPGEGYDDGVSPRTMSADVYRFVRECFAKERTRFHRNVRNLLNGCFRPDLDFDFQLRKVWLTESVLCSAEREGGNVPAAAWRACRADYLQAQLRLFDRPVVAALGSKAQGRTKSIPGVLPAFAVAPPGCNFTGAKESWATSLNRPRSPTRMSMATGA